jgi:hypothetical protein
VFLGHKLVERDAGHLAGDGINSVAGVVVGSLFGVTPNYSTLHVARIEFLILLRLQKLAD